MIRIEENNEETVSEQCSRRTVYLFRDMFHVVQSALNVSAAYELQFGVNMCVIATFS